MLIQDLQRQGCVGRPTVNYRDGQARFEFCMSCDSMHETSFRLDIGARATVFSYYRQS